jgi:hypothetical protein
MRRLFWHENSQAGAYCVTNRFIGRVHHFREDAAKHQFLGILRNYQDLLRVEVLTFCIMSDHFQLLVRVPHRPPGFDVPLKLIIQWLEPAIGEPTMAVIRCNLAAWKRDGETDKIHAWRQAQVARMFSLSEFIRCVKLRFTRWHNTKLSRRGTIWEERFESVRVPDAARAIRGMAAYIDLSPVRAGLVDDPADYRWCGYGEAMMIWKAKPQPVT